MILPSDHLEIRKAKKATRAVMNRRTGFIRKLEETVGSMENISRITVMNSWAARGVSADPLECTDALLHKAAERLLEAPSPRVKELEREFIHCLRTPAPGRSGSDFAHGFSSVRYRVSGSPKALAEELIYSENPPQETTGREYFTYSADTGEITEYAVYDLRLPKEAETCTSQKTEKG